MPEISSDSTNLKKRSPINKEEDEEALLERIYGNQVYDSDSDDDLPYGGKVYLARKSRPDPWWCYVIQVIFFLKEKNVIINLC